MLAACLDAVRSLAGGRCAACRAWCGASLCDPCVARFAAPRVRCARCALPLARPDACCAACDLMAPAWDAARVAVDWGLPWSLLVATAKFGARPELARVFAQRLHAALGPFDGAAPTLVVPVPLAPSRLRRRGYNQAWELARRLARERALPACADALFRVRETPTQRRLHRDERMANLRDAFAVTPGREARVRGACVALVDDVLTTGATAAAATVALRRAGAREVHVWAFARAV